MEELYEREANEKHERLAEMRAEYNFQIKGASDAEKERLEAERDEKL